MHICISCLPLVRARRLSRPAVERMPSISLVSRPVISAPHHREQGCRYGGSRYETSLLLVRVGPTDGPAGAVMMNHRQKNSRVVYIVVRSRVTHVEEATGRCRGFRMASIRKIAQTYIGLGSLCRVNGVSSIEEGAFLGCHLQYMENPHQYRRPIGRCSHPHPVVTAFLCLLIGRRMMIPVLFPRPLCPRALRWRKFVMSCVSAF